jgi:hypothetical protein
LDWQKSQIKLQMLTFFWFFPCVCNKLTCSCVYYPW